MSKETHVYESSEEGYHWGGAALAEGTTTKTAEVTLKIRSLFDAGTLFYTKEAIRDVCQQLEKAGGEKGQKVSVRGLDGVIVDFDIDSGRTFPSSQHEGPDLEFVLGAPFIDYVPIQQLTSSTYNSIPRIAYCNLRISHHADLRNKFTKEIVTPAPTQSREEVEQFFQTMRQVWDASEPCKQLRSTLVSTKTTFRISKIVGLACGPVTDSHRERWARSAFQHGLLLTLRDVFDEKKETHDRITCYAQDPAYTEIDEAVLEGVGITVLDDPQAFLEVDDFSVVVSCSPNVPVKQIVSDLAKPAVMIWDRIGEDDEHEVPRTDPDSSRLREMIHTFYDQLEYPDDREHFGDLAVCALHFTVKETQYGTSYSMRQQWGAVPLKALKPDRERRIQRVVK